MLKILKKLFSPEDTQDPLDGDRLARAVADEWTAKDPAKPRFEVEGVIAAGISDERQKLRRDLLHRLEGNAQDLGHLLLDIALAALGIGGAGDPDGLGEDLETAGSPVAV